MLHEWEPTDTQGYEMECFWCGLQISLMDAETWNSNINAPCSITEASAEFERLSELLSERFDYDEVSNDL